MTRISLNIIVVIIIRIYFQATYQNNKSIVLQTYFGWIDVPLKRKTELGRIKSIKKKQKKLIFFPVELGEKKSEINIKRWYVDFKRYRLKAPMMQNRMRR